MDQKKILIVEDELPLQSALKDELESAGFLVVAASDGEAGLATAKQEKPDLILIDILMPKMDGIAMAREIKKAGIKCLMIFLTNFNDAEHIAEAADAAYSDYLVKSECDINDIVAKVKERLGVK